MLWMRVFEEANCTIMQKPTGTSKTVESQNTRDAENKIRLVPKPMQASMTQVLKPRMP